MLERQQRLNLIAVAVLQGLAPDKPSMGVMLACCSGAGICELMQPTHGIPAAARSASTALPQNYKADLLFGDWGYYCTPALSEMLQIPRVTVSNIPLVDPLHTTWDRSTGRRMHVPNVLAHTPQASLPLKLAMRHSQTAACS